MEGRGWLALGSLGRPFRSPLHIHTHTQTFLYPLPGLSVITKYA
jgi:hypothetical protein